jgi:hypothetical protein
VLSGRAFNSPCEKQGREIAINRICRVHFLTGQMYVHLTSQERQSRDLGRFEGLVSRDLVEGFGESKEIK